MRREVSRLHGIFSLGYCDVSTFSAIVWAIFPATAWSLFVRSTSTSNIAFAEQTRRVPMPKYFWHSHQACRKYYRHLEADPLHAVQFITCGRTAGSGETYLFMKR